jgi:hypothetical protein
VDNPTASTEQEDRLLAGAMRALLAEVYVWWPDDDSLGLDGWADLTPEQAAAVRRAASQ